MTKVLTDTDKTSMIDETLHGFFERSIDYATRIDPSYRQLWETLYGLIRSGGKKLRPKMTLMAYEAFGGSDTKKVIPVAAAQELLHFSLLIHDDIIDRDYIRYGVANVAGQYRVAYSKYIGSSEEQTHYAHSAAILGGDLMLSAAHQLIANSDLTDEQKMLAQNYLSQSIFEVAGGELLDTELSFGPYADGDAIKVARYKTAGYSFVGPLMTGATLATISDKQAKNLHTYAISLGVAFQLVDDLLGIFGDQNQTGKSVSSDILEGKRTYLVEQALKMMSTTDKAVFSHAFGNPQATAAEVEGVRNLLESSGAKKQTEQKIQEYVKEAENALSELKLSSHHHDSFAKLISLVTERTS